MICPIQIEDESKDGDSQEDVYDVEFIFGKKMKRKETFYAVKWLGYSIKQMTWEPKSNFTNQSSYLIQRFESRMAYQIFQKVFNPKKETIRIHIKQRFYQIYSLDPQTRNIFNQFENQSISNKNHQQVQLDNELPRAKKIIDGQKKILQKVQRIQENEIKNQDIMIANLLNKQTIKRKKEESKLELSKDNKYTFPPILQENQIKQLKYPGKEKNQLQKKNFELEKIFQYLIEQEQQEQLKLNDFQLKQKDALNSNTQNQIKRIKKLVDDCQIIIQPSQKKLNVTNIMKIKKKERSEPVESNKIQERKIRQLKQNKKEFEYEDDQFDIEISFNDQMMIEVKTFETVDHSNFLKQKQKSQIESKEINFLQNCEIKELIDLQKVDSPEQIYYPKFKLEREYINEIIVNQRKKELEIYKSGNIMSVIKKDPKSFTQVRTSQQLQEINKMQLEKIASNKTSRCSVPIIPRVKEKEVQIDENEFPSFEMTIYNEQMQPIVSPRLMIESIISHHMLNNLILFKCLYENGQQYYLDFQRLSLNSPTLLLDYMRVNSILI